MDKDSTVINLDGDILHEHMKMRASSFRKCRDDTLIFLHKQIAQKITGHSIQDIL
jgi:hypothetical protein